MFLQTSLQSLLFKGQKICFALSDRFGGVSKGAFSTLNLGYYIGDKSLDVDSNYQLITTRFYDMFCVEQGDRAALYYCQQIHSTQSVVLDKTLESLAQNRGGVSISLGEADGIITQIPYRICVALAADCNPILLYDKAHHAMAVIHAGRKGVFDGILPQVFAKMNALYQTQAADCLLYVGASIRSCCYEVGGDICEEAMNLGFSRNVLKGNRLDLMACLQEQCENLHIQTHQVEVSPYCSCCDERLYSYRRDKTTGRYGLLAMLL
ncbi:polyphenol oxidase family protein [uncultured Helicobacter sp.]|uniref:polyphenol oxidase family protein n=4 Tax=uncultured Helicobacter sp. TaxID=175537 RepID=UPI0025EC41CB|nr:polyphenol oxidase family protein [uncultured Helicobacter sp.]